MAEFKRKNYLINPKFQIHFSIYVLILLLVLSLIYSFAVYQFLNYLTPFLGDKYPQITQFLDSKQGPIINFLFYWQIGFSILAFLFFIFLTHKVAGPIYKICQSLELMRSQGNIFKIFLRKGDYFKELADSINMTLETIEEERRQNAVYISEIDSYLKGLSSYLPQEKKKELEIISNHLEQMQNQAGPFPKLD